jgi:hypothetical protein
VRAKLKREAAAANLYLKLTHSINGYSAGVRLDSGYPVEARSAGLLHISGDDFTGTIMDWVRSVLTREELLTISVFVEADNSMMEVDYFATDWARVLPDWDSFVDSGTIAHRWAKDLLGLENNSHWVYDRGIHSFTCSEIASLCPSDSHATALAVCVTGGRSLRLVPGLVNRLAGFDATGLALFQAMLPDWSESPLDLLYAVEALVPQEAPAPVPVELVSQGADFDPAPAPVAAGEMPPALRDYLGRLLHEPKRVLVLDIWGALQSGGELPVSVAPWAADVQARTLRYAKS